MREHFGLDTIALPHLVGQRDRKGVAGAGFGRGMRLAQRHPELVQWTDNVRLIQTLIGATVLNEVTAHVLKHAYLIYRAAAHQLSLQAKPATVPAEKFDRLQQRIRRIWKAVFQER